MHCPALSLRHYNLLCFDFLSFSLNPVVSNPSCYEALSQLSIFLFNLDKYFREWARKVLNWNISCNSLFVSQSLLNKTSVQVWSHFWLISFLHLFQLSSKVILVCEQVMLVDLWFFYYKSLNPGNIIIDYKHSCVSTSLTHMPSSPIP